MIKGIVISGVFGKILVREKSVAAFELGELLIAENTESLVLMQVYDLSYGSQISQQNRELVAGMHLEEDASFEFLDPSLRNYNLALLKNLVTLSKDKVSISKTLPRFFSEVREIGPSDLGFITKPKNPLFVGNLRSGSNSLDSEICLDGSRTLSHHILISGTTGRGKSVLVKNLLWSALNSDYSGILVLDPHDEYYGRGSLGLKDHPRKEKVVYYTPKNPPPGCMTLKVNLASVRPHHFNGVVVWSDPQEQALSLYFRKFREKWIEAILLDFKVDNVEFHEGTMNVIKRRLMNILDVSVKENEIVSQGLFDTNSGLTTVEDITKFLESGKVVVVDTSLLSSDVEILVGSLITTEVFESHKGFKTKGTLQDKPVVSIVLEEAPRVLGRDILEKGPNIFSTIAREGRKFRVGLTAITQLPSLIPREILANINTKIILGIEMKMERQAIIESASQDLSDDDRNIASLDIGEAIISSNFVKFATPVKIPFFEDFIRKDLQKEAIFKKSFTGVKLS